MSLVLSCSDGFRSACKKGAPDNLSAAQVAGDGHEPDKHDFDAGTDPCRSSGGESTGGVLEVGQPRIPFVHLNLLRTPFGDPGPA